MYTETPNSACRLWIGTSGYSYAEWTDAGFYPSGTKSGQMLPVYAQHFPITELNYTWYQMPKAHAIDRMRQLAPPDFRFAAKLTRTLTHEINPHQWRGQAVQSLEFFSLSAGFWSLVAGFWPLVSGPWSTVLGFLLMVA